MNPILHAMTAKPIDIQGLPSRTVSSKDIRDGLCFDESGNIIFEKTGEPRYRVSREEKHFRSVGW